MQGSFIQASAAASDPITSVALKKKNHTSYKPDHAVNVDHNWLRRMFHGAASLELNAAVRLLRGEVPVRAHSTECRDPCGWQLR